MMKYVLNEIWMNLDEIGANERALHRYIKLPFVKFLFLAHITAILMMVLLEYTRQLTHSHRIKKNTHTHALQKYGGNEPYQSSI